MSRRRGRDEAREVGAMMRRLARAMTKRVAEENELDALVELTKVADEIACQIDASFLAAEAVGYSQRFVARELGISQQAVQQHVARAKERAQAERETSGAATG